MSAPSYIKFAVQSNFSFLQGASSLKELVIGAQLRNLSGIGLLAYPQDRTGRGHLCRLLTAANLRGEKVRPILYLKTRFYDEAALLFDGLIRRTDMLATYRPIVSLLRGTAYLLAASGLLSLLMPLRGQAEHFSTFVLGLLGTAWATGFVAGCYFAPRVVRRAGHIRAFSTFAAVGAIIALLNGLLVDPVTWVALRVFTGFTMAGCFMIIESWLNERATNENRGTVFGLYMMVTYASIMAGQMTVAATDVTKDSLFMVAGILFCCSLIPTAVSTQASPEPLQDVSLDLKGLYANSPVAFGACLLIGVANGAWGTLGAVYGGDIHLPTAQIALMMSLVVIAGAVAQMPVGRLSDRMDRRYVLAVVSAAAAVFALAIFILQPRSGTVVLSMTAAYGAMAYTLYSIAVAHANDHAKGDFIKVSSGLLLLYGFGTIIGPNVGSLLMTWFRPESLFLATAFAHAALALYTVYRISKRAAVPVIGREAFQTMPADKALTPAAVRLDPRTQE